MFICILTFCEVRILLVCLATGQISSLQYFIPLQEASISLVATLAYTIIKYKFTGISVELYVLILNSLK